MSNKAIFTGTFSGGISLSAIVPAQKAEDHVIKLLANGTLAEALAILDPASKKKRYAVDADTLEKARCHFYIALRGASALDGIEVYGPFVDDEQAEHFGENVRGEDGEWQLCEITGPATSVEGSTEILQHNIAWWLRGGDAPTELDEFSVEHIANLIGEGYNQGELCVMVDGEKEYRGWWHIAQ